MPNFHALGIMHTFELGWGKHRWMHFCFIFRFFVSLSIFYIKKKSSCKISNEIVARIEISFKEKYIRYLEFLSVYYMDDPICKDHDWKFFDCISSRKGRNIINLNLG